MARVRSNGLTMMRAPSPRELARVEKRAREKANAYATRHPGSKRRPLHDFERARDVILDAARAADVSAPAAYDRPGEVIRRKVYQIGLAYRDADAVSELRDYVQCRDGDYWGQPKNLTAPAFFWAVRLVSDAPAVRSRARTLKAVFPVFGAPSWSKSLPLMEQAAVWNIDPEHLSYFVHRLGGWEKGVAYSVAVDEPPAWAVALSRVAV